MQPIHHKELTILFEQGNNKPILENKTLTIQTHFENFNYFQKADISLSDNLIQIIQPSSMIEYRTLTHYYVFDYGKWNWRSYKDASVEHYLNQLQAKTLFHKDRHQVEFIFGSTKLGKETLSILMDDMKKSLPMFLQEDQIRIRDWDQTQEILVDIKATKVTFFLCKEKMNDISVFLSTFGYPKEAQQIKDQRMLLLFGDTHNFTLDFKDYFKKTKK